MVYEIEIETDRAGEQGVCMQYWKDSCGVDEVSIRRFDDSFRWSGRRVSWTIVGLCVMHDKWIGCCGECKYDCRRRGSMWENGAGA